MADLCILVPTFEKYRAVAAFTRAQIDRHWPGHPPVFFCGLPGEDPALLPLRDDPADWMALVRAAIADLQARGYRRCYLVLDDHPPMDRCHSAHLGETLPRLMDELGASFINLQGWGQYRPRQGADLGARYFHLEKSERAYLWKFALHPGLWNLQAFGEILDLLLREPALSERTCWKFERRAGQADFPLPEHLRDTAYRVCGTAMSAHPARRLRAACRRVELFAFDVVRFGFRILGGQAARDRFDARFLGVYHFYDGPYPLFWSGVMKKGRLNHDLVFFLRWHRRQAQLAALRRALEPVTV
jgi:hypothetical protein